MKSPQLHGMHCDIYRYPEKNPISDLQEPNLKASNPHNMKILVEPTHEFKSSRPSFRLLTWQTMYLAIPMLLVVLRQLFKALFE